MRDVLTLSLVILVLSPGIGLCQAPENAQDTIESLNGKILKLKTRVTTQNKEIDRLKRLCENFGINPSPEDIALPSTAISKPMFGVYLGETIESLENRHRVVGFMTACALPNSYLPGKLLYLYSSDPSIDCIKVLTYQEQVYTIKVTFRDGSKTNYNTVKEQLEETYANSDKARAIVTWPKEGVYTATIDGVEVSIALKHKNTFIKASELQLIFAHTTIRDAAVAEMKRQKEEKP